VWSAILVEAFVRDAVDPLLPDVLKHLRGKWWDQVAQPNLPWFAQAKIREGGAATFVGLHIDPATRTFRASAVGDSCLFRVRASQLLFVGPIERSDQFSRYPGLLRTRPGDDQEGDIATWEGRYVRGDLFVLATDAVAKFLLLIHEKHGRLPLVTDLVRSKEQFQRHVTHYRRRGLLENDDASLCVVEA
jgi:hypothetical protein